MAFPTTAGQTSADDDDDDLKTDFPLQLYVQSELINKALEPFFFLNQSSTGGQKRGFL